MSISIRARLLLLALSWALPALIAGIAIVVVAAQAERQANERTMRETARAMSLLVERELAQRAAIARVLSLLRVLDRVPQPLVEDREGFIQQARRAMAGLDGWVEVVAGGRVLIDSRLGAERTPTGEPSGPAVLVEQPTVAPLQRGADGVLRAAVVHPVVRGDRVVANLVVTVLPAELQRLVVEQSVPATWIATVMDSARVVVARHPGGEAFAGRPATDDLRRRIDAEREGLFESVALDGNRVTGHYATSAQGWTFITAMPYRQYAGYTGDTVVKVGLLLLLLLALAVAGALIVSRGIERPLLLLKQKAARLQRSEAVNLRSTGIAECDEVAAAMAEASETLRHARLDLERQVADAVARTREAEQRVAQSRRVEALGRLTGGVAHDFNNLLGVISNSAHLVQRHADKVPALAVPVGATLRAVDVGSRLTQHLLRFAGRRPVRPQAFDLARGLPEIAEMLRTVVGRRIEVTVAVAPDTRAPTVDSGELELALINLTLNARDAMPEGGRLWIEAGNAVPAETAELPGGTDYVAITVRDTGTGIAPDIGERVFEPFFTTKSVGQGTGLGLSQVHGFATQAGGAVRLRSVPGQGTIVTMLLPAGNAPAPAPLPRRRAAGDGPEAAEAALAGVRVLLVEDNEALAEVTEALLAAHGARVRRAGGPQEALQVLAGGEHVDVLLSDIVMPGAMDGVALARLLRRHPGTPPVVLISGYSAAAEAAAEFTVLRKPCTEDELVATLQQALRDAVPAG